MVVVPILVFYAVVALPAGVGAIGRARVETTELIGLPGFLSLFHSRTTFFVIFAIQLVGVGVAAVNAAIEIESIVATGALFGLLFSLWLTLFTFTGIAKERLTRWFALSAPLFTVALTLVVVSSFEFKNWWMQNAFRAQHFIQIIILFYALVAIPIGLYALAKELQLLDAKTRPRVSLKWMFVCTAILAAAMGVARPCLEFGVTAYLGGALFVLTVVALAALFGYWFYKKVEGPAPTPWTLLTLGTVALLLVFCVLVYWYADETDYGACTMISSAKATVMLVESVNRQTYKYSVDESKTLYPGIRSGEYAITVLDRMDLEPHPKTVSIKRRLGRVDPHIKLVAKEVRP